MSPKRRFRRVAVIGGGGYVGSALVPRLIACGVDVSVIDLFLYGESVLDDCRGPGSLRKVRGDIRDAAMLRRELDGAEAVVHLACISNDPSFELDPELGRSINYDAFFGLMEAVRCNRVRRFIYASSSSVYGVREEPDVVEESPCDPLTDYSRFKLRCEEALASDGLEGTSWTILRPATVCGDAPRLRLDVVLNALTISALARKAVVVHGGGQLRPNINIKDMVDVYDVVLEADDDAIRGEVFNAGYQNRTVADLADLAKHVVGDPDVTLTVKPTNDARSYHVNSEKIRRRLGFAARHDIADAIRSLCTAYRSGRIPNALSDSRYYNVRRMKQVTLGAKVKS